MDQLLQKLKDSFDELTAGQKKVARVFFEEPNLIAFTPAFGIGKYVNVSESTVIRLTQKLGYKGYAEVQELVQRDLANERVLTQYKEISNISHEPSLFHDLMEADIQNIQKLQTGYDEEVFQKAIKAITEARRIYITGNLLSYGFAHFFTQWMNMILGNTEMIVQGDSQYYQQLSSMNEDDLVIALIFPRYMESTIQTVQYSKQQGAKVLSLTDSELSPIAKDSDLLLPVPINSKINIDSYTSVLSLLTAMMRFVSIQDQEKVEKNLKKLEKVYEENNVFHLEN